MAVEATDSETAKSSCRVIIVGGGLAGLATAIGVKKAGFQVLVLEQAAELREVIVDMSLEKCQSADIEPVDWSWD